MLANIAQLDFSGHAGLRERVDAILADANYETELAKLSAFLDVSPCWYIDMIATESILVFFTRLLTHGGRQ